MAPTRWSSWAWTSGAPSCGSSGPASPCSTPTGSPSPGATSDSWCAGSRRCGSPSTGRPCTTSTTRRRCVTPGGRPLDLRPVASTSTTPTRRSPTSCSGPGSSISGGSSATTRSKPFGPTSTPPSTRPGPTTGGRGGRPSRVGRSATGSTTSTTGRSSSPAWVKTPGSCASPPWAVPTSATRTTVWTATVSSSRSPGPPKAWSTSPGTATAGWAATRSSAPCSMSASSSMRRRPATGQLQMIAGSHRGTSRLPRPQEAAHLPVVPLPTEPGDVTVHFGHTLHAAPPPTDHRALGPPGPVSHVRSTHHLRDGRARAGLQRRPLRPGRGTGAPCRPAPVTLIGLRRVTGRSSAGRGHDPRIGAGGAGLRLPLPPTRA